MKKRIVIIGLGAVGGYYGGLLAYYAEQNKDLNIEVDFMVRDSAHTEAMRAHGLRITSPEYDFVAHPHALISEVDDSVEPADYIIIAVKSYSMPQIMDKVNHLVKPGTVVLPLLNGLDVHEQLKSDLTSEAKRWAGIAYITSRRSEPGLIVSTSENHLLCMGDPARQNSEERTSEEAELLHIMQQCHIEVMVPDSAMDAVRRKYMMLSNSAAATAYFNTTVEHLLGQYKPFLVGLTEELMALYEAKGWLVEENCVPNALRRISRMPDGTTTSMHTDLINRHESELESLVGYVVRESERIGLSVPYYREAYKGILQKLQQGGCYAQ